MDTATDHELIQAHIAGNAKAFASIVNRYQPRLLNAARRYSRTDHDAWDILQEALFKASQHLDSFRAEAALSTWLHRLVQNTSYDFSHRRAYTQTELAVMDDTEQTHTMQKHSSYDPFISQLNRIALLAVMEKLPVEQREALYYIDVCGYSVDWVARRQGVASGTVKSRRARAKQKLKNCITDRHELDALLSSSS